MWRKTSVQAAGTVLPDWKGGGALSQLDTTVEHEIDVKDAVACSGHTRGGKDHAQQQEVQPRDRLGGSRFASFELRAEGT